MEVSMEGFFQGLLLLAIVATTSGTLAMVIALAVMLAAIKLKRYLSSS
jgi:hypothetical protein